MLIRTQACFISCSVYIRIFSSPYILLLPSFPTLTKSPSGQPCNWESPTGLSQLLHFKLYQDTSPVWSLTCQSHTVILITKRGPNAAALAENGHRVLHQSLFGSAFKQAKLTSRSSMSSSSSADCSHVMSRHTAAQAHPAPQVLSQQPKATASAYCQRKCRLHTKTNGAWGCSTWPRHISASLPWQQQSLCHSAAHPDSALNSALTQPIIWAY